MTIFPQYQDTPFMSSLIQPLTPYLFDRRGVNTPIVGKYDVTTNQYTIYNTNYQDGKFASGIYTMTQTFQPTPVVPPADATAITSPRAITARWD